MKKSGCSHTGCESYADSGVSPAFPWLGREHTPESAVSAGEMSGSAVMFCMCDVSILPEIRRWHDNDPSVSSAQQQRGCHILKQWQCDAVVATGGGVCPSILKWRSEWTRKSILMPNTQHNAESPLYTWDLTLYMMS